MTKGVGKRRTCRRSLAWHADLRIRDGAAAMPVTWASLEIRNKETGKTTFGTVPVTDLPVTRHNVEEIVASSPAVAPGGNAKTRAATFSKTALPDACILDPGPRPGTGGIEITHPFHPWRGRRFTLESITNEFGLKRVRVFAGCGRQVRLLPAAWTDLRVVDAFEAQAAGRSPFRADDLSDLRELVDMLIKKDCP